MWVFAMSIFQMPISPYTPAVPPIPNKPTEIIVHNGRNTKYCQFSKCPPINYYSNFINYQSNVRYSVGKLREVCKL